MIPYCRPKLSDLHTLSQSKLLENHTLHNGTYLYNPYMAVPPGEIILHMHNWFHGSCFYFGNFHALHTKFGTYYVLRINPLLPSEMLVSLAAVFWMSRNAPAAWHPKNDPTTATSMKISLKNRLRILSNHFAIIPSRQVLKRREFILELKRRAAFEFRQR